MKNNLHNRFNIQLKTYVHNGIVQTCGHRDWEECEWEKGCEVKQYAGMRLRDAYRKKGLKIEDHNEV